MPESRIRTTKHRHLMRKFSPRPNYRKRMERLRHVGRASRDPLRGLTNWQLTQYLKDRADARRSGITLASGPEDYRLLTREQRYGREA